MDYNQEYIDLLKRSLAGENETVRLYLAVMGLAPNSAIPKLLEIQADETDHIAVISDLLLEAVAGESADQEELVPGQGEGAQGISEQILIAVHLGGVKAAVARLPGPLDGVIHLLLAGGAEHAQPQERHGCTVVQQDIVIRHGWPPFFVMILL